MIDHALRSAAHKRVTVLTHGPMSSTHVALRTSSLQALCAEVEQGGASAGGRVTRDTSLDVIVLLQDPDAAQALPNRRDAHYLPVATPADVLHIADLASAAGAARLMLVAPIASWQQLSAASRLLPEGLDLALAACRIPNIIIFKPTAEPGAHRTELRGMARFARFYLSQLRFMLPSSGNNALRARDLANLAFTALRVPRDTGFTVVSPDTMTPVAGPGR